MDTEIKLSQYADDTTLILDGSEKSLSEALRILESFEKVSGLRLNSKKTEALWIGSCAGKSEKLHPEKDFNWQNTKGTKSTKLTEFQFRCFNQTLATNVSFVKMGYKDDIRCSFSHEEAENFTHLSWFCSKIERFWKHLIALLKDRKLLSNDYLLNSLVVLGLMPDTSENKATINFVLLLARFYIWLCRSKGNIPSIENFKPFLKQYNKEIEPFPL